MPVTHRSWVFGVVSSRRRAALPFPECKTGALYNRTPVNALSFRARVPPAGFEPATNRVEADCSNPLSYGGIACGQLTTVLVVVKTRGICARDITVLISALGHSVGYSGRYV